MTDDPTTTARLDTTDPDRPRGDVGLSEARREALAEAIGAVPFERMNGHGCAHRLYGPCRNCTAAALAPLVAGWIAEERAGALREAADVLDGTIWRGSDIQPWLRARADESGAS